MVINENKNKTTNPEFLVNNKLATDKTKVANGFNKYFVNVGATLAKAIAKPNVSSVHYIQQTVMETFYINPARENEIAKIISNFNDSASGWEIFLPQSFKQLNNTSNNLSHTPVIYHLQMGISHVKWN